MLSNKTIQFHPRSTSGQLMAFALFEIGDGESITAVAIHHQREADYH